MSMNRYVGMIALVNALYGCNAAHFSSSPNSGRTPTTPAPPTTDPNAALSCTAAPRTVKAGSEVLITVTGGAAITGPVFQTILGEDEVTNLKLKRAGDAFTKEDASANAIVPKKNGAHTVELRLTENSPKADGTCSFVVSDTTTPEKPNPICVEGKKSIGAHVAFVVDNSNSNATTDCPEHFITRDIGLMFCSMAKVQVEPGMAGRIQSKICIDAS